MKKAEEAKGMALVEAYSEAVRRWERLKGELGQARVSLEGAEGVRFSAPSKKANEQCTGAKAKITDLETRVQMAFWDVEFLVHRSGSFENMGFWPRP
jgi:pyruvate/2-oxoacid:ferredoxin oxidoreductase beta subunit